MDRLVTLVLTDDECLDVRMALNGASMEWGAKAEAARKLGSHQEAQSCESIRAGYGCLWEKVQTAQDGAPYDWRRGKLAPRNAIADKCGYVGCSVCDADNT
jgi:hypothetical protein